MKFCYLADVHGRNIAVKRTKNGSEGRRERERKREQERNSSWKNGRKLDYMCRPLVLHWMEVVNCYSLYYIWDWALRNLVSNSQGEAWTTLLILVNFFYIIIIIFILLTNFSDAVSFMVIYKLGISVSERGGRRFDTYRLNINLMVNLIHFGACLLR